MADEDAPEASFDVRLDWPEDELRAAGAKEPFSEPASTAGHVVPAGATAGVDPAGVPGTIGGVLGLVARQVQAAMAATEQGIAELGDRITAHIDAVASTSSAPPEQVDLRALLAPVVEAIDELTEASETGTAAVQAHAATVADLATSVRTLHDIIRDLPGTEAPSVAPRGDSGTADDLVAAVNALQATVARELSDLRDDLVQLKRRIAVRTSASPAARGLDDEDIDKIVVAVVRQLEETFERVPDDEPAPPPPVPAPRAPAKRAKRTSGTSRRAT